MPAPEVENWLKSQRRVQIAAVDLLPRAHPSLPDTPLSVSRGQAEAYYALSADNRYWIIKKFHPGMSPDRGYLGATARLLPLGDAFTCGSQRRVVSPLDLAGGMASDPIALWLDGTILMPMVTGLDLATLADRIREGDEDPPLETRAELCRELAGAVADLEASGCSHRDLSSGNVWLDLKSLKISLIDWDSIFHSSLAMPSNTTCGTPGYIAPFVWVGDRVDPQLTWHPRGDRFALALICAEILSAHQDSNLTGDGGMFDQRDLKQRSGASIDKIRSTLSKSAPDALALLDRAIAARGFDDCPSPGEWVATASALLGISTNPPVPIATDWFDENRFIAANATRQVAPAVIVLPGQWGASVPGIGSRPSPTPSRVVPFEEWSSNRDQSDGQASRGAAPMAPGHAIVSFEQWGSNQPSTRSGSSDAKGPERSTTNSETE